MAFMLVIGSDRADWVFADDTIAFIARSLGPSQYNVPERPPRFSWCSTGFSRLAM
jgi:hypothetical protein